MIKLPDLIESSIASFKAMTGDERAAHRLAQKQSFVRGEIGIGSDKDERDYREAITKEPPHEP